MEKLLTVWIDDQTSRNVPLSQIIIQNKAQSLFNDMKIKRGEQAKDSEFGASRGWFDRFRKRANLHNIRTQGEAAAADNVAAENFPRDFAKIIVDGDYTESQIFNVDETALFWKKMPTRTFIAREEQSMPGFKPAKDRITLLLGANASGSLKLKPLLIYHSENPRALKNYIKTRLPVHWRSNRKAWVTAAVFQDWFENCFIPEVKDYCKVNSIPFKILLVVDNAPGHPRTLDDLHPDVRVIFLPPNTTPLLQPMDQGVIATFKFYYLRTTFSKCIAVIDSEEGTGQEVLKKFWKSFTILDGIKTIRDAWENIKPSTLKGAWKKLCPQFLNDFEGFENTVSEATENIIEMAKQLQLDITPQDVEELIESHSQPLSNEDLLALEEQTDDNLMQTQMLEEPMAESKGLTSKILSEAFRYFEAGMALLEKHDPDFERSSKVNANIVRDYACYTEIYREKKRLCHSQTTVDRYFRKRTPPTSTECPSNSPIKKLLSANLQ